MHFEFQNKTTRDRKYALVRLKSWAEQVPPTL